MEQDTQNPTTQSNELTIRDLVIKLRDWFTYLLSKWKIIVIGGILGALVGVGIALIQKKKYIAELTFVVEDGKSGGSLGAYSGIASQFGIDLGMGGSTSGVFSGDNIIQFLQSRLMVEKTLLDTVRYEGKNVTLAELYFEFSGYRKKWAKVEDVKALHFNPGKLREKFSIIEDSVLNIFQAEIRKKKLEVAKLDKKMGFISVKCTASDETFAKEFTIKLVDNATEFYISSKISQSKLNVDRLQKIADSLRLQLNGKTYSIASSQDINQNPAKLVSSVQTQVMIRDKVMLETMFGEVVKNLELSKITMVQETPVITIVDVPVYPLDYEKLGKVLGLILGGVIGGFIVVIILIVKKVGAEIMKVQP